MPRKIGDMTTNYAQAYNEWYDCLEEECPECHGTGLDRDEIYDCDTCFGEGVIVYAVAPVEEEAAEGVDSASGAV